MKIYTRTGDRGTTSLVGGTRVAKDDARLEAYGTVDELNSWLGLIVATAPDDAYAVDIRWIQNKLFDLGCQLATEPDSRWKPREITDKDTSRLEELIDAIDATLPQHNRFILPGGTASSAQAQIARTVARRAERRMITLAGTAPVAEDAMRFINRLSDLLFVYARHLNHTAGTPEQYWDQDA